MFSNNNGIDLEKQDIQKKHIFRHQTIHESKKKSQREFLNIFKEMAMETQHIKTCEMQLKLVCHEDIYTFQVLAYYQKKGLKSMM